MRVSFPDVKLMKCPPRAADDDDIPPKQFTEQPLRPAAAEVDATSSEPPTSRPDVASGRNTDEPLVSDAVTERVPVGVACVSCPVLSCRVLRHGDTADRPVHSASTRTRPSEQVARASEGKRGNYLHIGQVGADMMLPLMLFKIRRQSANRGWETFALSDVGSTEERRGFNWADGFPGVF